MGQGVPRDMKTRMHVWRAALLSALAVSAAGVLALGIPSLAGMAAAQGTEQATSAGGCSIGELAARQGLAIQPKAVNQSVRSAASIKLQTLIEYPSATTSEEVLADVQTNALPDLNNRLVWLLRLDNLPAVPVSGPVGHPNTATKVGCAVTAYDARSGEFILTIKELLP